MSAIRFARAAVLLLAGAVTGAGVATAGETQIVFDVSPFEPAGVGGELLGISSASGHVIHARIDATFVSNEPGEWSLWANFALPTGIAGVDSEVLGWEGAGTFSTTLQTDAFNGLLGPPRGETFFFWFVEWAGGVPFTLPGGGSGIGPVDGVFTQLVLTLTVCDCPAGAWADLGHGLAGTGGTPQLAGSGNLCPVAPGALALTGAKPGGSAFLVVGLASVWLPFHGGLLMPDPGFLVLALPLDGAGTVTLPFVFPAGVPADTQFWFQGLGTDAGAVAGFAASNALLATVPDDC